MNKFILTQVRKLKGVGMEISYKSVEESAEMTTTNKYKTEITEQPSNELLTCFQSFGKFAERTMGVEDSFIETEEVKMTGSGENESIVVKGKYYSANDLQGTVITPRMKLYNDTFGFELEMQQEWEKLSNEVMAFLFDGKRGEVESFN